MYGNVIYNIGGVPGKVEVKSVNAVELGVFSMGKWKLDPLYTHKVFFRWLNHLHSKPNFIVLDSISIRWLLSAQTKVDIVRNGELGVFVPLQRS